MCEGTFASHDARQRKSSDRNERTDIENTQRAFHRLVGTRLWVTRESDGRLAVWIDLGSHLLRKYVLGGERQ